MRNAMPLPRRVQPSRIHGTGPCTPLLAWLLTLIVVHCPVLTTSGQSRFSELAGVALAEPATSATEQLGAAGMAPGGYWSMFRRDARHAARVEAVGPAAPTQAWQVDLGGLSYSSPAIGLDGTVYVGAADRIVAVNADGTVRWVRPMNGYVISSPAIGDGGLLYAGCRDGNVYGVDAATGEIRWTFETGDEVWSSPAIGRDGTVFVGSFDGTLYALHPDTGGLRWSFFSGGEIISSPAVSDAGLVYTSTSGGFLSALTLDGLLRWQQIASLEEELASSPVVSAGRVIIGSVDGSVYAFDASSGRSAWTFATDGPVISSPAVADDGTIYFGSLDGGVYALNGDGSQRWRFAAGAPIISSPAIDADGSIYVGTVGGEIVALSPAGEARWSLPVEHPVWSSPSLDAEGAIVVASTGTTSLPGQLHRIVEAPFDVRVTPPPHSGTAVTVVVSRMGSFAPTDGVVFYRLGGERTYREAPLERSNDDELAATIPAEALTARGVEYYIRLTDGQRVRTLPVLNPETNPIRLSVEIDALEAPLSLVPRQYRVVSIPLLLEDASAATVLEDDYGPSSPNDWRLFAWTGDDYAEHPDFAAQFSPGDAHFLITQDGQAFDVQNGRSMSTDRSFPLRLEPGWNLVGNPFAFPVAFDALEGDISRVQDRAYFDGTEMVQQGTDIQVLRPWEGLFVRNSAPGPITLLVPPLQAEQTVLPKTSRALRAEDEAFVARLHLATVDGSLRDTQNWIVTGASRALPDIQEAPAPPGSIRLSITDQGLRYARRFSGLEPDGARWNVEITAPASLRGGTLRLTTQVENTGSGNLGLAVFDAETGEALRREEDAFQVTLPPARSIRRLVIMAAPASDLLESVQPARLVLEQNYPNPFNPTTEISFTVPFDGRAIVEVFDALGRMVHVLLDAEVTAGRHVARWDGIDEFGRSAPSGVYFYRITAGSHVATRSMVLLR